MRPNVRRGRRLVGRKLAISPCACRAPLHSGDTGPMLHPVSSPRIGLPDLPQRAEAPRKQTGGSGDRGDLKGRVQTTKYATRPGRNIESTGGLPEVAPVSAPESSRCRGSFEAQPALYHRETHNRPSLSPGAWCRRCRDVRVRARLQRTPGMPRSAQQEYLSPLDFLRQRPNLPGRSRWGKVSPTHIGEVA